MGRALRPGRASRRGAGGLHRAGQRRRDRPPAEPQARVLVLGTAGEAGAVAELVAACADPRVVDTAGELPLRRLFAVMAGAHSVISLDTGPAHAAAALGCPLAVIVGSADPRRNRPLGPPRRLQEVTAWPEEHWPASPHEWVARHQMAQVAVDDVLAAWARLEPRRG